ncbi:MAG TPA: hypothetical protein GX497_08795 [Bacillus bacterium]|nr:hypothetical protein [Bacillus sp. (in: firmicutes)]
MTSIIEQLSNQEIINSKIIKKIKDSINNQYPHYTSKQRARMIAVIIYNIIERSLPNYSNEVKRSIRNSLIKQKLSGNTLIINFQDVVEYSVEVVATEELHPKLLEWLHTRTDIEIESIEKFVSTILEMDDFAAEDTAATSQVNISDVYEQKLFTSESVKRSPELTYKNKRQIYRKYIIAAIAALSITISLVYGLEKAYLVKNASADNQITENKKETTLRQANALPSYLQYEPINEKSLQVWLNERNSKLADEPYFSSIIAVANQYNLHPFLLFAITGQEQSFVPRSHQNAENIANNPFNVYQSWEDYNTNITDSTQIAAKTIVNLSKERPEHIHPIEWINRKYAEDPNWWKGVSTIFAKLEKEVQ